MLEGRLSSCSACPEQESRYSAWTCRNCEGPVMERTDPRLFRALFWKKLTDAGYPLHKTGLSTFEMWLLSLIKEMDHGP